MKNIFNGRETKLWQIILLFASIFLNIFVTNIVFPRSSYAAPIGSSECYSVYGGQWLESGKWPDGSTIQEGCYTMPPNTKKLEDSDSLPAIYQRVPGGPCPSTHSMQGSEVCDSTISSGGDVNQSMADDNMKNARDYVTDTFKDNPLFSEVDLDAIEAQCREDGSITQDEARSCMHRLALDEINKLESEAKDCKLGPFGWVLCPMVRGVGEATAGIYTMIEGFFTIRSSQMFGDGSSSDAYKIWSIFRDIANVVFAILLLIVVMSQVTGLGISNYGIKKMLPRMIAMAIVINSSWWISVALVDLSNLVGWSIRSLLQNIVESPATSSEGFGRSVINGSDFIAAGTIVVAGASAIALAGLALSLLVAALIALVTVVAVLILRDAAIILLVVISPLAFAMAILPNTEKLFDQWKKIFQAMLVIYPTTSLIFGVSILASNILMSTTQNAFNILLFSLIPVIPLFMIPSIFKKSLTSLGAIGASIAAMSNKASSSSRGAMKGYVKSSAPYDMIRHNPVSRRLRNSRADQVAARQEARDQSDAEHYVSKGMKRMSGERMRQKTLNQLGVDTEGSFGKIIGASSDLSDIEMRRMARSSAVISKQEKESKLNEGAAFVQYANAVRQSRRDPSLSSQDVMKELIDAGNKDLAAAGLSHIMDKGTGGDIEKAFQYLSTLQGSDDEMLRHLTKTATDSENNNRLNDALPPMANWAREFSQGDNLATPDGEMTKWLTGDGQQISPEDFTKLRPSVQKSVISGDNNGVNVAPAMSMDRAIQFSENSAIQAKVKDDVRTAINNQAGVQTAQQKAQQAQQQQAAENQRQDEQYQRDLIQAQTLQAIEDLKTTPPTPRPRPPRPRPRPGPRNT